jgi:hypothetical protein
MLRQWLCRSQSIVHAWIFAVESSTNRRRPMQNQVQDYVAHSDASRQRGNSVAFGAKRTLPLGNALW